MNQESANQKLQSLLSQPKTLIMGILNVTPDSFSDGGQFNTVESAITHATKMIKNGADIIDIGGESTKPFSDPVPEEIELKRTIPIIKILRQKYPNILISIDSMKPEVTKAAIEAGANIINDVTGLRNKEMIQVAKETNAPVIIMHMLGTPKTMQNNISDQTYNNNIIGHIKEYLNNQAIKAIAAGIKSNNIILDPGIGFGKTTTHNLEILKHIKEFQNLGFPILIGASRKSFIGKLTKQALNLNQIPGAKQERLEGSLSSAIVATQNGAKIIRTHDVKATKKALIISDSIKYL